MTGTGHLKTIEERLLWLSHWMVHHANHIRPKADGIKIGGHQANPASVVSILTPDRSHIHSFKTFLR